MNLKELIEKRNAAMAEMKRMLNLPITEKRDLSDDEFTKISDLKKEVESLDRTIALAQEVEKLRDIEPVEGEEEAGEEEADEEDADEEEAREVHSFAEYIRGVVKKDLHTREDVNITKGDNGAVIPKTIVNKIIDKMKEISPLWKDAQAYTGKGTIAIPYVDAESDGIAMTYATEFQELEAKGEKLLTVDLTGFLAGVLAKVSKSLINNTDLDIVGFVTGKIAMAATVFYETELFEPSQANKITGLSTATTKVTAASATAITADELIALQGKIHSVYQRGAYFVMHPNTLTAVRQLKDSARGYIFDNANNDQTQGFAGTILGKPVYTSDYCPEIATKKAAVWYINPSEALAKKVTEDVEIQVLTEKYATQHALGIVGFMEIDAKVQNQQAVAFLEMA